MSITRRNLLKLAAAGTAVTLVGLPRKSGAAPAGQRFKRLVVLYVEGGWRCSMALKASANAALNPFGAPTAVGALKIGPVMMQSQNLVTYAAPSWPGAPTVPPLTDASIGGQLSVAHCHPAPLDADQLDDDHSGTGKRVCTGYNDVARPGILNLLTQMMPDAALPPMAIGAPQTSAYALQGPLAYSPILIDPRTPLPAPPDPNERFRKLREKIEANLVSRRPASLTRAALNAYRGFRATASDHGAVLSQPQFDGSNPAYDAVAVQGISNKMLKEAAGINDGTGDGLLALGAIRALQNGCRAALVSYGGSLGSFDLHSAERTGAPMIYPTLGRLIVGLKWLLDRVPSPDGGGPLANDTVLVVLSEFGRLTEDTPFNAADGSDHNGTHVERVRNQSVFLYGGGLPKGQLIGPNVDDAYNIAGGARPVSMHCLWATLLAGMGIRQDAIDESFPPTAANTLYPERAPLPLWG